MESFGTVLPIIIYILLIMLLIIGIILGIKLIITIDKVNDIVDDLEEKMGSLNNIFKVINFTSNKLGLLSSKVIDAVTSFINKLIGVRNGKEDEDDYE